MSIQETIRKRIEEKKCLICDKELGDKITLVDYQGERVYVHTRHLVEKPHNLCVIE